jgi:hypothetical protein
MGCCLLAVTLFAWAQSGRKPGLWEVTVSMTMGGRQMPQMPQLPPDVQLPPGMKMPQMASGGGSPFGAYTTQVCVTQEMIDKFGGPTVTLPNRNADCKLTDISIKANSMTATMVCTGNLNATGEVESTWTDASATHTSVHLKGSMQMGPNSMPLEMTMQSTSVYKSADCGSVKPMTMPKD